MPAKKKMSFEEGLEELEKIVKEMEEGKLPLDKSFEAHEKGVALIKELTEMLNAGEKRITELTAAGEKAFEREESNEDA